MTNTGNPHIIAHARNIHGGSFPLAGSTTSQGLDTTGNGNAHGGGSNGHFHWLTDHVSHSSSIIVGNLKGIVLGGNYGSLFVQKFQLHGNSLGYRLCG